MKTRFILIETSHAGNVGAAARALATMGFEELVLVAPRDARVLTRKETVERASGAVHVLQAARVVATLDEALDGLTHLCATAMIGRDFGPPTLTPRAHFEALAAQWSTQRSTTRGLGVLFGSERFGMRNADVWRCHAALRIDSNPAFGSLNLGAAVQLIAHEWRQAIGGFGAQRLDAAQHASAPCTAASPAVVEVADAAQVAAALQHWRQALEHIGFLDPAAPKKLLPRLQQIANRAALRPEEVHILRGIARTVLRCAPPVYAAQPSPKQPNDMSGV